jgi:hypothetical protein
MQASEALARGRELQATVAQHKAAIRHHRARLGAAKAALVQLEANCRRLGIGLKLIEQEREHATDSTD